jgi:glycosyltransferase involved in cell wall biosynthesis
MKKILFLSAIDFKSKSIQVIRKTPEAFRNAGWHVDYIVARDNISDGNYFYEEIINPEGIEVNRFSWRIEKMRASFKGVPRIILNKIASWLAIFDLYRYAKESMRNTKYDVIYGYEYHGVLALYLSLALKNRARRPFFVSRFQGTFYEGKLRSKKLLSLLFNFDHIFALSIKSDLIVMTDDGTMGDKFLRRLHQPLFLNKRMLFIANGVDIFENENKRNVQHKASKSFSNNIDMVCLSRLVEWKKVERSIFLLDALLKLNDDFIFNLTIIGGGPTEQKLKTLTQKLNLTNKVKFTGPLSNKAARQNLEEQDLFLSFYDESNVGNPLLEAFRANLIPITLDNGATSDWVTHNLTGLIYNPETLDFNLIAKDIISLISDRNRYIKLKKNIKNLEDTKIKTWDERFKIEIKMIETNL